MMTSLDRARGRTAGRESLAMKCLSAWVLGTALLAGCAMGEEAPSPDAGRPTDARVSGDGARADAQGDAVAGDDARADAPPPVDVGPGCVDMDGDGYGSGASCRGPDCDDRNRDAHPGAAEVCNNVDDNCNGMTDDGLGTSMCGTGACARTVNNCEGGMPRTCTPGVPVAESCNGMDDDCDGMTDENQPMASCGTGACARTVPSCVGGVPQTCTPGVPGAETCNGVDDDCDGMTDEDLGSTTCGTGACARTVPNCVGGVPQTCTPGAPGAETCNGVDDNCNGAVDDGVPPRACYSGPAGTQGVGRCRGGTQWCSGGSFGPCVGEVLPTAEVCGNGVDDNCNGAVDDGCVPAVSNDTCGSATAYTIGSTVSGDTTRARNDYASTCGAGGGSNDVAYVFTSDGSATTYTITSTTTSHDGVLHVHSSASCSTTDEVGCNDDYTSTRNSQVVLTNLPRGSFYIVQDGYASGNDGPFTLSSTRASINHDTCATPARITANGTYTGTTTGRGANYTASCGYQTNLAADVVYVLTARTNGTITATTCGSSFDTVLYVGTTCGGSTVGATTVCNDDSCGLQSSVTWSATAGTTYYIVVDGYNGASGSYELNITGY
jgi:hypothetical protein